MTTWELLQQQCYRHLIILGSVHIIIVHAYEVNCAGEGNIEIGELVPPQMLSSSYAYDVYTCPIWYFSCDHEELICVSVFLCACIRECRTQIFLSAVYLINQTRVKICVTTAHSPITARVDS